MPNKMLIDATHPEETRVVVIRGNRVEEFDFETAQRKQLRGNIYLAKVTRVEPSLQAAFIEYGGNRHGFLAFSEIHPDYYQIPVADRLALIEADERAHREAEEESENRSNRRRPRHRNSRRRGNGERVQSDVVDAAAIDGPQPDEHEHGHPDQPQPVEAGFEAQHGEDHAEQPSHEQDEHDTSDNVGGDDQPHAVETAAHDFAADAPAAEFDPATAIAPVVPNADAEDDGYVEDAPFPIEPPQAVQVDGDNDLIADLDVALPAQAEEHHDDADEDDEDDGEEAEEDIVESVGGDDVLEEVPERAFRPRRQYKIQEVIKRRQVMLVQVVKEERGNKGAALTTYLSLAGRYAVLMPNTARGGGISRKITSAQDRSRLKEVVQDLDVPEGMGIILRTAGASRTKPEIKRDFEYLIRMWETVRDMTLKSQAPTLVYEEGSLIKRSLRDLYNKEIDEIQVAGEAGYQEARDFMQMLMPSNVRAVKQYRDGQPLFSRMGVESQLDAMFSPTVQLRSGGYIVINQTEALVSIDVNSGRSTREHHIEDTALKTNIEAAEEVARQLRLRDLAGLIVIDFIDMEEKRNNRAVERKISDCLRQDRARIQIGRISHFGLLEMSRQRIRASVLESSTEPCPHCGGSGHVRSVASVALQLLRGLEEILMKGATHNLIVRTRSDVALYVLNHKRGHLRDLEDSFRVSLTVIADPTVTGQQSFVIDRGEQVHTLEAAKALLAAQVAAFPPAVEEPYEDDEFEFEAEIETDETVGLADDQQGAEPGETEAEAEVRKRKRRRRRRGRAGEAREGAPLRDDADATAAPADAGEKFEGAELAETDEADESADADGEARLEQGADGERRPRRRGRRGGRRRRGGPEDGQAGSIADDLDYPAASEAALAVGDLDGPALEPVGEEQPQEPADYSAPEPQAEPEQPVAVSEAPAPVEAPRPEPVAEAPAETERSARRRSTVREKVHFGGEAAVVAAPQVSSPVEPQAMTAAVETAPIETAPIETAPTETAEAAPAEQAAPVAAPAPEAAAQPRRAGWWSRRFGGGE
ncbi:ribonuclease E [Rhodopseudomonas rhenobacensis]|uniref:Ribonuclease E n=1 Tax=Rhodopseudomonas rhenobacensis TaxID=87461 RepID=A0A7W7Z0R5_9BRAD|nr:Rne/Rng family ribonuclease [Rhodopseudomonas rhenobacensis]MBB5045866.1 ribonuclease E [Rhodopseudomonas rhenobacensis]